MAGDNEYCTRGFVPHTDSYAAFIASYIFERNLFSAEYALRSRIWLL